MDPSSIVISDRCRGAACLQIDIDQPAGITVDVRPLESVCMVSCHNFASEQDS